MPVAEIRKRQPDVALALVGSIVHYNQEWLFTAAFPGKGQKTIPSPVAIPRGSTFEQLPLAFAHGWRAQHSKQPVVELLKPLIDRFFRCSNQMGPDGLRVEKLLLPAARRGFPESAPACSDNPVPRGNARAPAAHDLRAGGHTTVCRKRSRIPVAAWSIPGPSKPRP